MTLTKCECSVLCAAEAIWCTSATCSCLSSIFIQRLLQVRLCAPQGLQRILVTFGDCWCKIFTGQMPLLSRNQHCQYLDLDLDSSRIQVDASYHTLTPFLSVESCWLSLLQASPIFSKSFLIIPLQFVLGWPGLSYNQELSGIMLVVVDAGDPSVVLVQASEVFVLWECCQWFVA